MDHYIDITLRQNPEFSEPTLMGALFIKLHRALVNHGKRDIGISFPDVAQRTLKLGPKLRLHGSQKSLTDLMANEWIRGIRDYVNISSLRPIPSEVKHLVVQRVQAKSSPERMRRRLMARKSINAEAARVAIPDHAAEKLNLPYVEIASLSTRQRFRLFIHHTAPGFKAVPGRFGSYGLSTHATVPWF
jgi:CRISPR-associated endonuclease Csy4